jgi:hypothetical protein
MKHIRRSLKYFIQITVIFAAIIGALMLAGLVSKDVNVAFREGWKSIGYIVGVFFVVSFVYPFMGYGKRNIRANGDPAEHRANIDKAMEQRGYVLESETPEGKLRYHLASPVARIARLWEDTITIKPQLGGFEAEGLMRDLARVVMSIDRNINSYE